jgi:hypothetical protein
MRSTKEQIQICREEWFKDHKATHIPVGTRTSIIEWQKPDSWNYGCRFILHSQWLVALGDIGEAVYQWSEAITPKFLAGLDFGYFHSKCRASEVGSRFQSWDSDLAFAEASRILKPADEFIEMISKNTDQQEFSSLLHAGFNRGMIDCDTAAELAEAGTVPHPRCVGHFVGIQMAIEQLGLSA